MKLDGDQYIDAAPERASAAQALYQDGRYTEAVYLAGVAVECVLRAYAQEEAGSFDARHDLRQLFKAATLERFVGEKQRQTVSAALGEVWARWKNNYRYAPEERMRKEVRRLRLDQGVKGDVLKETARVAIENALVVVNKGKYQWKMK
jgi:HEPN domain-containing protein